MNKNTKYSELLMEINDTLLKMKYSKLEDETKPFDSLEINAKKIFDQISSFVMKNARLPKSWEHDEIAAEYYADIANLSAKEIEEKLFYTGPLGKELYAHTIAMEIVVGIFKGKQLCTQSDFAMLSAWRKAGEFAPKESKGARVVGTKDFEKPIGNKGSTR